MKNKLIIATVALLGVAGFTACTMDTEPRLEAPTEFVLNTPPMANNLYVFDCNASGVSQNDITFTVSQPNYGVATTPTYTVQLARSAEDFAKWDQLQADGDDSNETADGLPLTVMVDGSSTDAKITFDGEVFCTAVNQLYGLTLENVKNEPHPVAVRVHAALAAAAYSAIWSNSILINVRSYIKPVPDKIWIVGACQGWDISKEDMVLEENEIGSKIYVGDYNIPAGQFQFRFYDELGDWDAFSIGSQYPDNPIAVEGVVNGELPEEGLTVPCYQSQKGNPAKGSWQIDGWKGGKVHFEVNLNDNTVTFSPGQSRKIYIVGACQGWNVTSDKMALKETVDGSDVYEGTFTINAGEFQFRFYKTLGDWDVGSIGSQEADSPVEITVPAAGLVVDCVDGKGSWTDPSWAGGDLTISVDLKGMKVTFTRP